MPDADARLNSIHAMLAAGHRCVRVERHTLLLLGGVGGLLSASTESVVSAQHFPDINVRAFVLLAWLGVWLGGMIIVDHMLTSRSRARNDEAMPFAQAQITRAWWMLLAIGVLCSFAMFFYGGGRMIYGLWIVLLGLGMFLFGLFSRLFIEWVGTVTVLLGIAALAAGLSYEGTRWLTTACFAIGMPLAAWLDARLERAGPVLRALALLLWIAAVVSPVALLRQAARLEAPVAARVTLAQASDRADAVVALPAETRVALRIALDSPLLRAVPGSTCAFTLKEPLDVELRNGRASGMFRVAGGAWSDAARGALYLSISHLASRLGRRGPEIDAHAVLVDSDLGTIQ